MTLLSYKCLLKLTKVFLIIQAARDLPSFNQHNMVSLSINGDQNRASILAFFNNQPFHTPPLALALADIAVVRAFTNNNNITITTSNHPLPRTDIEKVSEWRLLSFIAILLYPVSFHYIFFTQYHTLLFLPQSLALDSWLRTSDKTWASRLGSTWPLECPS